MTVIWMKLNSSAKTAHAVRVISDIVLSKKALCGIRSNTSWAKSSSETKCAICHQRVAGTISLRREMGNG